MSKISSSLTTYMMQGQLFDGFQQFFLTQTPKQQIKLLSKISFMLFDRARFSGAFLLI